MNTSSTTSTPLYTPHPQSQIPATPQYIQRPSGHYEPITSTHIAPDPQYQLPITPTVPHPSTISNSPSLPQSGQYQLAVTV